MTSPEERASSQPQGDVSEPSTPDSAPWLSISNHSALEGIVNIPPLLISVPKTLSPLTSLSKINTKGQSR